MNCSVFQIRACVIEGGQLDGQAEIFGSAPIEFEAPRTRVLTRKGVPRLIVWDITGTIQEPSGREAMITHLAFAVHDCPMKSTTVTERGGLHLPSV